MTTNTSMHVYDPRTEFIPICPRRGMSRRDRLYTRVARTYAYGHYEFAQALYHLLEEGHPTQWIELWWKKALHDAPHIVTQSSAGNSVHAARG